MHNLVLNVGLGLACGGGCGEAVRQGQMTSLGDDVVIRRRERWVCPFNRLRGSRPYIGQEHGGLRKGQKQVQIPIL